jgi:hypothetical protein
MRGFAEGGEVGFVDKRATRIDEGGEGGEGILRPGSAEMRERIVVEVVKHAKADGRHGVGLLRDGGGDEAFVDPVERIGIRVHSDDDFVLDVALIENDGDVASGLRFEADEGVDIIGMSGENFGDGAGGNVGIAGDIDDADDMDLGIAGEGFAVAAKAVGKVGLFGDREEDDIAFLFELLRETLAAHEASLVVIRPYKEEALAGGGVGVEGDDGDAGSDGLVDVEGKKGRLGNVHENAGGFLADGLLQSLLLSFGIVGRRSQDFGVDLELGRGVGESGGGLAPVGDLEIVGDEDVFLGSVVTVAGQEREQEDEEHERTRNLVPTGHGNLLRGVVVNSASRNEGGEIVNEEGGCQYRVPSGVAGSGL